MSQPTEQKTQQASEAKSPSTSGVGTTMLHKFEGMMSSAKAHVESAAASVAATAAHLTATDPLTAEELRIMNACFRAANYLTIGQIYLRENPMLIEPLKVEHIKPRLLGHWGTSPGLSMLYIHMNRIIVKRNIDAIFMCGPGHGGPAIVAQTYIEGTYTEVYPKITQNLVGMRALFRQFSTPGGIPSHVSPNVPGSIHEGGELGYVLTHAFGAVMDNPSLIALAIVGDGEAETGPLEGSWKGISFINPVQDGAVLPVLHLNGYKISGPTVLGRETDENIRKLLEGHGYEVLFVEGTDPLKVHQLLAKTFDYAMDRIQSIQSTARAAGRCDVRPRWPMIVMRTPKGWTGPKIVDGKPIEGTFRSHQVPLSGVREQPEHMKQLEQWLKSYSAEELFDGQGKLRQEYLTLTPVGTKRMSAQPYTNGGLNSQPLKVPDLSKYEVKFANGPASELKQSVTSLGQLCRDLYASNPTSFRLFCPDETNSNRLGAVFETQKRALMESVNKDDEAVGHDGRVMEVLSEHNCNGWMEGYNLTGRFGLLATYEAFAMIFNSMTLQNIKWLEVISGANGEGGLPWRKDIPSTNILLTSTCWRNDHNGFSHQGPSFVDTLLSKPGGVTRIYFPIDANSLLVTGAHCLQSMNRVNLIVQDKQPQFQYLTLEQAKKHFAERIGVFNWASNDDGAEQPDIVMACCGDVMTQEALAATAFLRQHAPNFRVRFVNVLDLMALYPPFFHPHGLTDEKFDSLFTRDIHVIFAYHAYPTTLHQLIHGRSDSSRFHVRGYRENGTTTTPFDMVVLNQCSRFHLVKQAIKYSKRPPPNAAELNTRCDEMLERHHSYVREHFEDMKEIQDFKWSF